MTPNGNVTQMTYPSGRIVTFARQHAGADLRRDDPEGFDISSTVTLATTVSYQPFGPLQSALVRQRARCVESNRAHTRTDHVNLTNIWDNVILANRWQSNRRRDRRPRRAGWRLPRFASSGNQ